MKLIIDSTLDAKDNENVCVVPLVVTLNEKVLNASKDELYKTLVENKSLKTSQPSPADFVSVFNKIKENNEEALVLTLSKKLSGTYQSACLALDIVDYDKIYLYDTESTSIGSLPIYDKALELLNSNLKITDIIKELDQVKEKITLRILPNTLEYLYLGGRLSKTKYFMANLLLIKPVITVIDGVVEIAYKSRGFKKGISDIVKEIKTKGVKEGSIIYLGYTNSKDELIPLIDEINVNFPNNIVEVIQIGTVVGTHVGPNGIGISYLS